MINPFVTYKITVIQHDYSFDAYNDDLLCLLHCALTICNDCIWKIYKCDRIEGLYYERKLVARSSYVV